MYTTKKSHQDRCPQHELYMSCSCGRGSGGGGGGGQGEEEDHSNKLFHNTEDITMTCRVFLLVRIVMVLF